MPREAVVQGVGSQPGNWNTFIERVLAELQRARQLDRDAAQRSTISSIRHYRRHRFIFNTGEALMRTEEGRSDYGLETFKGQGDGIPTDLLEFDEPLRIDVNPISAEFVQSSEEIGPPRLAIMERISELRLRVYEQGVNNPGTPYFWAYFGGKIRLYPPPDDAYFIHIPYLQEMETPSYQIVGGAWTFYDSAGVEINPDSYSTPWLDEAEELIRARTEKMLYAQLLRDPKGANNAQQIEMEALQELEKAYVEKEVPPYIEPNNALAYGWRF